MIPLLLRCLLVACACGVGTVGGVVNQEDKVELVKNAAMIEVSVMNGTSDAVFNTSFIFGVYGQNSLTAPATGQLVHVRSAGGANHGCDDDYNHTLPHHDWVALIERGRCVFTQKVNTATKRYNASAVLVYDNEQSNLIIMRSMVEDEAYVFLSQAYGRRLALMVDSGLHVRVNITEAFKKPIRSSAPSSCLFFISAWHFVPSIFLTSMWLNMKLL